jgi:hypothetical protein
MLGAVRYYNNQFLSSTQGTKTAEQTCEANDSRIGMQPYVYIILADKRQGDCLPLYGLGVGVKLMKRNILALYELLLGRDLTVEQEKYSAKRNTYIYIFPLAPEFSFKF